MQDELVAARVDSDTRRRLESMAVNSGKSMSDVLRQIIKNGLERDLTQHSSAEKIEMLTLSKRDYT